MGIQSQRGVEDVIDALQQLCYQRGRVPLPEEVSAAEDAPPVDTCKTVLGVATWDDVLIECGLFPISRVDITESLCAELRAAADRAATPLDHNGLAAQSEWEPEVYSRHFGSLPAACRYCNIDTHAFDEESKIPDEQLESELARLRNALDHTPTPTDMNIRGRYGAIAYQIRYDSWSEALGQVR